jgi:hypothetical protein
MAMLLAVGDDPPAILNRGRCPAGFFAVPEAAVQRCSRRLRPVLMELGMAFERTLVGVGKQIEWVALAGTVWTLSAHARFAALTG